MPLNVSGVFFSGTHGSGGTGASPGGSDKQLQKNSGGSFGAVGKNYFLDAGDDIAAAIAAASAGDCITLGPGTFNVSSGISCNKSIHIVGQGPNVTIINSTMPSDAVLFTQTADVFSFRNIGITGAHISSGIVVDGSSANGFDGKSIFIENVRIVASISNVSSNGINFLESGGTVRNCYVEITNSSPASTQQNRALFQKLTSLSTKDTFVYVFNGFFKTVLSSGSGSTTESRAIMFWNNIADESPNTHYHYLYNVTTRAENVNSGNTNGLLNQGNRMLAYMYGGVLDGSGSEFSARLADLQNKDNAYCYLFGTTLAFNRVTGGSTANIIRTGTFQATGLRMDPEAKPTIVTTATGRIGGQTISFTGCPGGDSSIATTGTGGAGGGVDGTLGTGGVADSANTASTGGKGGTETITGGTGGAASATGINVGGAGGDIERVAGAGGAASGGSSNTGGDGGNVHFTGGPGGTGATANGANGNVVVCRTISGTNRGVFCIKTKTPDAGQDVAIDGAQISTTQRVVGITRNTNGTANGFNLIVHAGGAANGATDKAGGNLLLRPGISTGSANGTVKVQTNSAAASGTSDNSFVTKEVSGCRKNLTNDTAAVIAVIPAGANSAGGGTVFYTVVCDDGTNFQSVSGLATYSWTSKAGVLVKTVTDVDANKNTTVSSGTLVVAWSISAGMNLNFKATSSLTPSTLRVYYKILNHSDVEFSASSPF